MSVRTEEKKLWWQEGVQFECQGSGKCCTSHGEFGFVFLTLADRRKMAKFLKMSTPAFTRKYCEKHGGVWHLIEKKDQPDCMFLKNKRCSIYEARPMQCRTWPFWPEVMGAKEWNTEVKSFCPGVGKGRVIPAEEIKVALKKQKASEALYGS